MYEPVLLQSPHPKRSHLWWLYTDDGVVLEHHYGNYWRRCIREHLDLDHAKELRDWLDKAIKRQEATHD